MAKNREFKYFRLDINGFFFSITQFFRYLTKKVADNGYSPFVVIRPENEASQNLYKKLGYRLLFQTKRMTFLPSEGSDPRQPIPELSLTGDIDSETNSAESSSVGSAYFQCGHDHHHRHFHHHRPRHFYQQFHRHYEHLYFLEPTRKFDVIDANPLPDESRQEVMITRAEEELEPIVELPEASRDIEAPKTSA